MRETVTSVRRSCFEALGDRQRVFKTAVLKSRGVLGSRIFASDIGPRSMVLEGRIGGRGCRFRQDDGQWRQRWGQAMCSLYADDFSQMTSTSLSCRSKRGRS